jgi:hypothetical protein
MTLSNIHEEIHSKRSATSVEYHEAVTNSVWQTCIISPVIESVDSGQAVTTNAIEGTSLPTDAGAVLL